jgi:AraC-like DNA-binding protein
MSIEIAHPPPRSMQDVTSLLGSNIRFGADRTKVGIDAATLDSPSVVHDRYLTQELHTVAERVLGLNLGRSGFVERAADRIIRSLPKGETSEADVAAALGRSVRDLQREFAAARTTFTALRDKVRMETAKRLLVQLDLQLTEN